MHYATFLFDHSECRKAIKPYVELAERGEFHGLVREASKLANLHSSNQWILEGHGTSINEMLTLDSGPSLIGFCFLMLISNHFHEPSFDYGKLEINLLADYVESLNWKPNELMLLRQGLALWSIAFQNALDDPFSRVDPTDALWGDPKSFWLWIRPMNSYHEGWWTPEQVILLSHRMQIAYKEFELLDVSKLTLEDSRTRVQVLSSFKALLRILSTASEKRMGLVLIAS